MKLVETREEERMIFLWAGWTQRYPKTSNRVGTGDMERQTERKAVIEAQAQKHGQGGIRFPVKLAP